MRKVSMDSVELGDELAVDVKIHSDHPDTIYQLRIDEGTELNRDHLNRLRDVGVNYVLIKDEETEDLDKYLVDEDVEEVQQEIGKEMKELSDGIKTGEVDDEAIDTMSETIDDFIEVLQDTDALAAFTTLKSHDDYTAKHCIDVAKLSMRLFMNNESEIKKIVNDGKPMKRRSSSDRILEDLGMGGLLHDLGKWMVPEDVLNKPGKLDNQEWEAIKSHPKKGLELIRKVESKLNPNAKIPPLQHHEKYSGEGYPKGLSGDDIHIYGRISACCDVYSALTSNRSYRMEMTPNRALQTMGEMQSDEQHFDPEILDMFFEMVPPFPPGQEVVLSNGTKGVVIELPERNRRQPVVRILYKGNQKLDDPYKIKANKPDSPAIVN